MSFSSNKAASCHSIIALTVALMSVLFAPQALHAEEPGLARAVTVDIGPQKVSTALLELSQQAAVQVLMPGLVADQQNTKGVRGTMSVQQALSKLLEGTTLRYRAVGENVIGIEAGAEGTGPTAKANADGTAKPAGADSAGKMQRMALAAVSDEAVNDEKARKAAAKESTALASSGVPEILVKGARSGNTDIRRTEDDVQPYVVFDAEEIERAMAPDLESFLRTRLPMNQSRGSDAQDVISVRGNQSTIDLRGLGADQTLILVNGRRMPGVGNHNDFYQADINGIPLAAVERIEILPSTAGGIYGGGATGGVVNIILKRNYNDLELTARYDGAFAGGGAERRLDATAGFTLEGGRTHVMLMGSYRDGNPLYIGDRNFLARARALQDQNNHDAFVTLRNPLHGYTTNIRSADGSDLVLKDGMRPLNSPIAHVPVGYAGPASDNGAAFLETADEYNLMPANDVLGDHYALLNAPSVRSLQLGVRREFTERIEAFVDAARYDNCSVRMGSTGVRSAVNVTLPEGAHNPFDQEVVLSLPLVGFDAERMRLPSQSLSEQLNAGVIVRLPREWTVQGEYSLGRSNNTYQYPEELFTADGSAALLDGRLDPLSDVNAYPLDFSAFYPEDTPRRRFKFPAELENTTVRVSGPLLRLPGGPLRLAALLERRDQFTGDRVFAQYFGSAGEPTFFYYSKVGSITESGYAELNAPLVSSANARPGLLGLEMRASYRHDATEIRSRPAIEGSVPIPSYDGPFPDVPYQTNNVTGNQYTLGLLYTPLQSVVLRLSYGEGILPPSPIQLAETQLPPFFLAFSGPLTDPKRGNTPVSAATIERYTLLGRLLLRPEQSASWSGGVIFTPANLPGFRLSVDYTRIEKTDEVGSLETQVLLDLEDRFPGAIVRNELTSADAALGYTGGTIRELNGGYVNIARSLMEAFDIQADYRWETRFGSFAANVIATAQPRLARQPTPDGETVNIVGYSDGPLKWRLNGGLRWSRGAWDLGWNLQYYDAARVYTSSASMASRDVAVLNQGSAWIPTQTYHDVFGRYRFSHAPGFMKGLLDDAELKISVQNVLNTRPPILATSNYSVVAGYATEGDPRLRRYSIAFTKRFGR